MDIEVYDNTKHYFLSLEYNITILRGNSATGKTKLLELIDSYRRHRADSGVTIKSPVPLRIVNNDNWADVIPKCNHMVIFMDEEEDDYKTNEFSELIRQHDNYYVIVSRSDVPSLPYSVHAILIAHTDKRHTKFQRQLLNCL